MRAQQIELPSFYDIDIDDELEPVPFESDFFTSAGPRKTKFQKATDFLSRRPSPLCNSISVVLTLICLVLLSWILARSGGASDSAASPSPATTPDVPVDVDSVRASQAAIATDDLRCSNIGRDIMQHGGNAVDAAVAGALCIGVVNLVSRPNGTSEEPPCLIMLPHIPWEKVIDAREVAPAAATQEMFVGSPGASVTGGLAVAVPGEVAGLHMAWQRHGQLAWERLVEPAIALAEGCSVNHHLARSVQQEADVIKAHPALAQLLLPRGVPLQEGDTLRLPQLAKTLRAIAQDGAAHFYTGAFAKSLAQDVQQAGGILTEDDLLAYHPVIRQPLQVDTMGVTVLGVPPPSSGGAAVIMILQILAGYALPLAADVALAAHRLVEAFKHAFALRMNLGDPSFLPPELARDSLRDMLDPDFAASVRANTSDDSTLEARKYGGKWNQLEDHGTSHLSVVDAGRMAVAMTTTINTHFGSKVCLHSVGPRLGAAQSTRRNLRRLGAAQSTRRNLRRLGTAQSTRRNLRRLGAAQSTRRNLRRLGAA
ncbi:hypothetical protein CYMTET_51636, partial [Cymbomonas tetramitiformis]